ncbi:VOC family protein [Halovenus sp. HT40]|uniref:VOC family protein n=1 Tax=Halovenus sp. HT40 TaxID=3126691 RepID=UPI00300EC468
MNTDELPEDTRIGRTALLVSNLAEMTEFYQRVVGLSVLDQSTTVSVLGTGETPLLVLEEANTLPESGPTAGLFHTAFRVPSRAALGDALGRIREHSRLSGATDHRVSEALYFTDPEGNSVEIYRDFPKAEWPIADDGNIRIGNDPIDIDGIEDAAEGETQAPAGTDIGHVHLEVSSLEAFRELYVGTLGFGVKTAFPNAYFVSAGQYHHHIAANTWHHRTKPRSGSGLSWFEVVLPEQAALEALRDRLAASQWTVTETDEGISVTDTDEIEIRFRWDTAST